MALGERAFKKALHTREHRERSQPAHRAKLGLLEKHKDYVERAHDYHSKERKLKGLRIKASQRNPDEFHHGMIRARQVNGVHVKNFTEATKSISADMLKLMKTQDVAYIALQKRANERKMKRLQEELTLATSTSTAAGQHMIFAEDAQEMNELATVRASGNTNVTNQDTVLSVSAEDMLEEFQALASLEKPELQKKREELEVRKQRVEQLSKLEYKLNLDRQLLGKGKRQKVGTDEYGFAKYKWAVERKK